MSRLIFSLMAIALLAGCEATGSIQQQGVTPIAIDSRNSATVQVTSTVPGGEATARALSKELNDRLLSKRVFSSLLPAPGHAADVRISGQVVELATVSQGARILFGALAGQAKLKVNVQVVDQKTATPLGSLVATGTSSGGHIFAGTTDEAVQQAAEQIVTYLLGARSIGTEGEGSSTSAANTQARLAGLREQYVRGTLDEATYLEQRRLISDTVATAELARLRASRQAHEKEASASTTRRK